MSKEQNERYRDKYHELLEDFEAKEAEWERIDQRTRRTLTQLILISQGPMDEEIIGHLDEIREALKRGDDLVEIEETVDKLRQMVLSEERMADADTQPAGGAAPPYPVHELVIQLIERLPLSLELREEANSIVKSVSGGINPGAVDGLLDSVASLVFNLRAKLESDKRQLEALLKDVTAKLMAMGEGISAAHDTAVSNFESSRTLTKAVNKGVRDIQDSAAAATDLASFREQLNASLEVIKDQLEQKQLEDKESEEQLKREVEQLRSNVDSLQKEVHSSAQQLAKAREASWRDPLTGCLNRLAYNERGKAEERRAKRHGQKLSVAIFDIDKFKNINDSFGHPAGDQVLKAVAKIADSSMRESDHFCRFGGEEFVALLPETGAEGALAVAEKVRKAVEEFRFHSKGDRVVITISAGVAQLTEDEGVEAALARADKALYQAKEGGRNRCVNAG